MEKYCTYFTFYLGNLLPPFYIGSTSVYRLHKGYHGSPSSSKYKDIWYQEIKNHPHLFRTFIIEYTDDMVHKLKSEYTWQVKFDAVNSPLFINMSYAGGRMIPTPEGVAKALETKKRKGVLSHSYMLHVIK